MLHWLQSPYNRMKGLATALLFAAASLFFFSKYVGDGTGAWGYLTAFAEAAMVGAVADWFAVTALFRHPLGLPIPHTAIIPRKKAQLGKNLANFICEHFLSTPQLMQKLRDYDVARRFANWLSRPANAVLVGDYVGLAALHSVSALRDKRAEQFIQATAIDNLKRIDLSALAGGMLDGLTADKRHQELLNHVLKWLNHLLQNDSVQRRVALAISSELNSSLHLKSLSRLAGGWSTDKLVSAFSKELDAIANDPNHELRRNFDGYLRLLIRKLKKDPRFHEQAGQLQDEIIHHPVLVAYLSSLWSDLIDWLQADLALPNSEIRGRISAGTTAFANHLSTDPAMQAVLNEKIDEFAPALIEKYRAQIASYIEARVVAWNEQELVSQLEKSIGKDLQFIRINGTLVGGAVGLIIHAVGRFIG
ncbi:DUF445 domain-containing protein [Paenalcaligenes niemegkensis]|uniref:DUF445 domain-containing protein n=1 Tax=Paenalcaligenes niemegkensis TaxID=2895469 RepID=UPI001EE8109E|nr:DUF445 domain-containing protein [Paenalcaligenes niemegkensis]MCQ9616372.1 DUF445 domain-containing protein [Paenalcaligenes niemegkensis]